MAFCSCGVVACVRVPELLSLQASLLRRCHSRTLHPDHVPESRTISAGQAPVAAHGGRSAGDAQLNGQVAMDVQMDGEAHTEGACFCLYWNQTPPSSQS